MKQVNFVVLFIFCLALTVFSIENAQPGTINFIPGVEVQAPMAVELLLAIGLGAVLAWLFSIWINWQRWFVFRGQVRQQNVKIQELEGKVEQYEQELQSLKLALPAADNSSTKEAIDGSYGTPKG